MEWVQEFALVCDGCRLSFERLALVDDARFLVETWVRKGGRR